MKDLLQSPVCARKLRSLADPDRLRIIQCLRHGPRNVGEMADILKIPAVNLSHHLRVLRNAEVVIDEKDGRFVVYRLNPDVYRPAESDEAADHLELGCCRLDIPKDKKLVAESP